MIKPSAKSTSKSGENFTQLVFILLLFIFSSNLIAQSNFKEFNIDEGLSQSQVYAIIQDSRGYLWAGTYGGGLNQFDGNSFKHFGTSEGLSKNIIYSIEESANGNLWIGTDGGGLCYYDGLQFQKVTIDSLMNSSVIYAIEEDKNGLLWIGTYGLGLFVYNPKENTIVKKFDKSNGLVSNYIHCLLFDTQSNLWIGTEEGAGKLSHKQVNTVASVENEAIEWTNFSAKDSKQSTLAYDEIYSIIEDKNKNILFGTFGGGISIYTPYGDWKYLSTENGLCSNDVTALYEGENNIWIGTYGGGICRIKGSINDPELKIEQINTFENLSSNVIWCITGDASGNVWFGTEGGGLIKYIGEKFHHFTVNNNLKSSIALSILSDNKGDLWFGTYDGWLVSLPSNALNCTNEDEFHSINLKEKFNVEMIITLINDDKNNIWLGTNSGLFVYNNGTITKIDNIPELKSAPILSSMVDKQGNLWFGTDGNGVIMFNPEEIYNQKTQINTTVFNSTNGLHSDIVWSIYEDSGRDIWLGTWGGGVSKLKQNTQDYEIDAHYNITNGLSDNTVLSILEDHYGNMWLATYGEGISVLVHDEALAYENMSHTNVQKVRKSKANLEKQKDSNKWLYINTKIGLSDNRVVSMIADGMGNFWAGTNKGINKISGIESFLKSSSHLKIQTYSKQEGFEGIECNQNAIAKDIKDNLWIGSAKFISRYNPAEDRFNPRPPNISINNMRLFFNDIKWSNEMKLNNWTQLPDNPQLSYEQNHITFDFMGISLNIPEKVRYQYKLEGYDDQWSPPVKETFATYPKLPPGKYEFKVKSCNSDGIWNPDPANYQFSILPPWYKTWWFYTLCIIIAISSIYLGFQYRIRSLNRQKEILAKQVKLRTQQLREEKTRVELQKEELEKAYYKLKKLENFKQSMMGMIVHDLKNPLNSILAFSQYEPAKDVLRNIYRSGTQMLNLVMNILDVQKFEDTEVKVNLKSRMLSNLIIEARNRVIHLAEQKEIQIKYKTNPDTFVNVDDETIIRVLVNLLTNAIKFTPSQGEILIKEGDLLTNNRIPIEVIDNGIGIKKNKLDTIFDQFSQVEAKDSGQIASTGLGLAFCKMAIEAHSGTINVESEPDVGTTFTFTLEKGSPTNEVAQNEIIDPNNSQSGLNNFQESSLAELKNKMAKFSAITVYHTSENIDILNSIPDTDDESLKLWKEQITNAVNNCNEDKYDELLQMIKDKV